MRPSFVVVQPPALGQLSHLEDVREAMQVEQFVADLAVERFDVRVLRWLAGLDEMQVNAALCSPTQHRMARKFGTVIKANRFGQPSLEGQSFEYANDVRAAKGVRNLQRQAFPCEIIAHVERAKCSARCESIVHEVNRPAFVGR